jgi:hypothetical protein
MTTTRNPKSRLLGARTNTADATPVVIGAGESPAITDLLPYFVQIQVIAAAGTCLVEVQGPGGNWTTHTSTADPITNDIINLSASKSEAYTAARVTFTGTGGTNTVRTRLETREP